MTSLGIIVLHVSLSSSLYFQQVFVVMVLAGRTGKMSETQHNYTVTRCAVAPCVAIFHIVAMNLYNIETQLTLSRKCNSSATPFKYARAGILFKMHFNEVEHSKWQTFEMSANRNFPIGRALYMCSAHETCVS